MKKVYIISLLIMTANLVFAEEQTFLNGKIEHGGYGAPVVKFTQMNGKFGVLVGGQGGWIINHTLGLGIGGYGLVTGQDHIPSGGYEDIYGRKPHPEIGYAGVIISYMNQSDRLIHPTFDLLIGGGSISLDWNNDDDHHYHDYEDENDHIHDAFFVVEPMANLEINMIKFMRINAGFGYRFVSGVSKFGYSNSDIGGISGNLILKFGKF
jgi:hypothetical protein